jgi:hypothetical protein
MRTLLLLLSLACLSGCAELVLKDLRVEVEAGEAVAEGPDSAAGTGAAGATDAGVGERLPRMVWQEQIQLKNFTTLSLHGVKVIINPEAVDLGAGYRVEFPEPIEPGAKPRIPLTAFRNRDGKPFPLGEIDIVKVRVVCLEGVRDYPGVTARKRFHQLDIFP